MRKILLAVFSLLALSVAANEVFKHSLPAGKKPWTHEKFLNDSGKFTFVIIPDRTGNERPGVFADAVKKANMLQPDFIITVGDIIQGPTHIKRQSPAHLREQWKELLSITEKSAAPFFYVAGNHDISRTRPGFPRANEDSSMVWKEFAGNNTYYSFIYKDVLFICLNIMEGRDSRAVQVGITEEQAKWAIDVLNKHTDVRWTMVFLHAPSAWNNPIYAKIEEVLRKRKYTSFAGDWHHYIKFKRYDQNHYVLATAGGVSQLRGIEYGEFDHLTYVTMTPNGPVVANLLLDGILPDDVVTAQNIKRHYTEILDSEPFVRDKNQPWRAIIDNYTLRRSTGRDDSTVETNQVTISGKNANGRKLLTKIIDIDHPNVGGKTLQLVSAVRAELPAGEQSSFNVHLRILDANNKIVKCDGITLKANFNWKYLERFVTVPAEGKRLQLVLTGVNFDSNSIGEARNIFIFEKEK